MSQASNYQKIGAASPRAFLADSLEGAAMHLHHAADHLALGDDEALERSLRKFAAFTKAALATFPEIKSDGGRLGR